MGGPRSHRLFVSGLIAMLGVLLLSGVALGDGTVDIEPTAFTPATITITPGDKVVWSNGLAEGTHTATADGASFDTGPIGSGQTATVTFLMAGTFPYTCQILPSMKGTIIVADAAGPTPTPSPPPTRQPRSPPPTDLASDLRGGDGGPGTGMLLGLMLFGAATVVLAFRLAAMRRQRPRGWSVILPAERQRRGSSVGRGYPETDQWTHDDPPRG